MPFCPDCDRFFNPNTLTDEGDCPDGHHVADPGAVDSPPSVPWHFKLMLLFLVIYLGWRLVQLLAYAVDTVF